MLGRLFSPNKSVNIVIQDGERRSKEAAARRKMRLDRKYVLNGTGKDSPSVVWSPSRSIIIRYSNVQELIKLEALPGWKLVADKDGVGYRPLYAINSVLYVK